MKQKELTVRDAKEVVPELDVYKFNRGMIYLFIIKPQGHLIGSTGMNRETVAKLQQILATANVRAIFLVGDETSFKVLEIIPEA